MKSDHLGKVSVGKQSQASDNTAILVDGSGSLVPANWVLFDGAGFGRKPDGTVFAYGNLAFCNTITDTIGGDCNGITENVVRYDSPVFAGFSMSASWGEDDIGMSPCATLANGTASSSRLWTGAWRRRRS